MKKPLVCFVLIAGIMASLSSCSSLFQSMISKTYQMVIDENAPTDQNVTVTFLVTPSIVNTNQVSGVFVLKEWNNNDIEKKLYGAKNANATDKTKLTVPAGNTSFTFDIYFFIEHGSGYDRISTKKIELRYDLEPGKEYQIKGITKSLGLFKGYEFFVGIFDATDDKNIELLKEWKVGEKT